MPACRCLNCGSEASSKMKRRDFFAILGGAAAAPLSTSAQEPGRTYRIGFLIPTGREVPAVVATFDELRQNGFIEGQNLQVVSGGFNTGADQIADMAAIIVKAEPDAVICGPELYVRGLQKITRTVALIAMTEDMVGEGLVASLARPGANTTGISILSPELDGKRQDLLIEAVPGVRKIVALADAADHEDAARPEPASGGPRAWRRTQRRWGREAGGRHSRARRRKNGGCRGGQFSRSVTDPDRLQGAISTH